MINDNRKEFEIKIAAYIAVHSSINSCNHFTDLIKQLLAKNSERPCSNQNDINNIRLHRIKCTMIIKNVIAESLKNEFVQDIGDNTY